MSTISEAYIPSFVLSHLISAAKTTIQNIAPTPFQITTLIL